MSEVINTAKNSKLDIFDYAILDMMNRDDYCFSFRFGMLKTCESMLKLYCHGMIEKLDRNPTFEEMEKIAAFIGSHASLQYEKMLEGIMTEEVENRIKLIFGVIEIENPTDMMNITENGTLAVYEKRMEMLDLYENMKSQYESSKKEFTKHISEYEKYMPMLMLMGLQGEMIHYMVFSSNHKYLPMEYSFNYDKSIDSNNDKPIIGMGTAVSAGVVTGAVLGMFG